MSAMVLFPDFGIVFARSKHASGGVGRVQIDCHDEYYATFRRESAHLTLLEEMDVLRKRTRERSARLGHDNVANPLAGNTPRPF